jgi:hypothetical protein
MMLQRRKTMPRWAAVAALLSWTVPGFAQERQCQGELPNVQREVTETRLSNEKGAQVSALMEQVVRACKENHDVVAMAGIDQVRAILSEVRKSESGS